MTETTEAQLEAHGSGDVKLVGTRHQVKSLLEKLPEPPVPDQKDRYRQLRRRH